MRLLIVPLVQFWLLTLCDITEGTDNTSWHVSTLRRPRRHVLLTIVRFSGKLNPNLL